jgi:hypothetical protein
LVGAAAGLKLTNGPFVLGAFAAVAVTAGSWRRAGRSTLWLGLGTTIGGALTGGDLGVRYGRQFGNPIYPFYNGVFRTEYDVGSATGRDTRFVSDGVWQQLTLPWRMVTTGGYPSELPGRDLRWALIASCLVAVAVLLAVRLLPRSPVPRRDVHILAAFMVTSWVAWSLEFGSPRYFIVLEQLSGVALVLVVQRLVAAPVRVAALVAVAAAATTAVMVIPTYPSNHTPGPTWYSFGGGTLTRQPGTMAIFPTNHDLNYMILAFRDDTQFVGLSSFGAYPGPGTRTTDDVHRAMHTHRGPLVAVMKEQEVQDSAAVAATYGFRQDTASCQPLASSYFSAVVVCPWVGG